MPRVAMPPGLAEFIRDRIANFENEAAPQIKWELPYVRKYRGLPLYLGWTETLAIRADGELIKWSTENEWLGADEFNDPVWVKVALTEGAKKYPELSPLVPERPTTAITCPVCAGTGDPFRNNETMRGKIVCSCGGVGWLPSGEADEIS